MTKIFLFSFIVFSTFISINSSCQDKDPIYSQKEEAIGAKRIVIDGKFWVWTQKIGDGKINVLLLHGGPGQSHEYFEIFEKYLPTTGITIYYYDQFGSYFSQTPTQSLLKQDSIWNISRYIEEVEQVRKGLGLDRLFIYGHSYGALLALAYTNKYQNHVNGLIFSDMNPDPNTFDENVNLSRKKTDSILYKNILYKSLVYNKDNGLPYDTSLYNKVFEKTFTRNFVIRLDTLPDALERTKRHKNMEVAQKIGPSTFSLDYTSMIQNIKVPVLLISGKYDFIIRPEQIKELSKKFKNSQYYIVPNGGHICFVDDANNYFSVLIKFIKSHSAGQ